MGLAERRAVEQFKNDEWPGWKAQIDQAAGFEVPVDVVWDQLAVDDYAHSYASFFPKVYFEPLIEALNAITVDDLGKSAAKEGLKKVVIKNEGDFYSRAGFTFSNGVLTLDHKPYTNIHDGEERAKGIQKLLEAGL
jgi:hypothetical protein